MISLSFAQHGYWQQRADYKMFISMDVATHQFTGTQTIKYTNNSPDELTHVYYHLYFNAFQPGSMMDVRSRTIADPDDRVAGRIAKLKPSEIGRQDVVSLTQNGKPVTYETVGTVLEVKLNEAIAPGSTAEFVMAFKGQVPEQIRRSGRNSAEGIDYSMSQWYPKLSEYDERGWNANPYVGREFHGVWGDFDVTIEIDSAYTVAASGVLQNADKIGHGYVTESMKNLGTTAKNKWHFIAENVHDFAWGADRDYVHKTHQVENGPLLHFFYQEDKTTLPTWTKLPAETEKALKLIEQNCGKYTYPQYSVVQGGDGGMEYPMLTLIANTRLRGGKLQTRSMKSLVGVTVHELLHMWYQHIFATDEAIYSWMDEGFTSYFSEIVMEELFPPKTKKPFLAGDIEAIISLKEDELEEPMTVHSDHFQTNKAYSYSAYIKGSLYLHMLRYIIGEEAFKKTMLTYYDVWKFKHPTPEKFKRVAEKISGIDLDWFHEHYLNTTNSIDYAIEDIDETDTETQIILERKEAFPMPLDIEVEFENGTTELYYIPMQIMRGEKPNDSKLKRITLPDWAWTHPTYTFSIPASKGKIKRVEIDPNYHLIDIDRDNNIED